MAYRSNKLFFNSLVVATLAATPYAGWAASTTTNDIDKSSAQAEATLEKQNSNSSLHLKPVKELVGMNVVKANGNKIGVIESIVVDTTTDQPTALLKMGGFLGIGSTNLSIPLSQLSLQSEQMALREPMSIKQVEQKFATSQSEFEQINQNTRVQVFAGKGLNNDVSSRSAVPSDILSSQSVSNETKKRFEKLDTNSDGVIGKDEATSDAQLTKHWMDADKNTDDRLEQAEFSAFETQLNEEKMEGKKTHMKNMMSVPMHTQDNMDDAMKKDMQEHMQGEDVAP